MAEGNGDASSQNNSLDSSAQSKDYTKLIELGLNEKVAAKLDEIYTTEKLVHADLDDRALDALKEFPVEGALNVLAQFMDANLEHVSNKSAYLCGVMKTYRQKSKASADGASPGNKGPNEDRIKVILDRTGYSLDVTTGQRKYGGPPPNWEGKPPGNGCEVFCGKIPKEIFEDELIPVFEKCGDIWDLRLMMDPMTGQNRGYAFVTFTTTEGAREAVNQIDGYEVRKNKSLKVNVSVPNLRLFVGNIPKSKDKAEIMEEFSKLTEGLLDAIIYSSPDDKKKNRGFCFLEYESHKVASLAKRRLSSGRVKAWNCEIIVDWADPQEEPDSETMSKVKVLYARNLTQDCTEEKLREAFEVHGAIERVKKIKDYAFVHFIERDEAVLAMDALNHTLLCGSIIDVSLAKPPSDKKKKEEILRNRERRMLGMMNHRGMPMMHPGMPMGMHHAAAHYARGGGYMRGAMMGRSPMGRGDYEAAYDYDYEMYGSARGYGDPYYNGYYMDNMYDGAGSYGGPRGRGRPPMAGRGRGMAGPRGRGGPLGGFAPRGFGLPRAVPRGMRRGLSMAGKRKYDSGASAQGGYKRPPARGWGTLGAPSRPSNGNAYDAAEFYSDNYDDQW